MAEDLRHFGIPLLRFCHRRQNASRVAGADIRKLREIEDKHRARALLRDAFESRRNALKREHRKFIENRSAVLADHILAARALEHLCAGGVECADAGFLTEILGRKLRRREPDNFSIGKFAVPPLNRH